MDIKDFIVVAGIVAIILIIWDGLRRMKANKPNAKPVQAKKEKAEPYIDPEEEKRKAEIARELPNGGARVREMTESEQRAIKTRINLRERVPMLMERVEVEKPEEAESDIDSAELQTEIDFSAAVAEPETELDSFAEPAEVEDMTDAKETLEIDKIDEELVDINTKEAEANLAEAVAEQDVEQAVVTPAAAESEPEENAAAKNSEPEMSDAELNPGPVEDLVIIYVMAPKGGELSGSEVLRLLLIAGLRHGPMDIFHYRNPKGITEFSLANCVQPGTFDPDSMNQVNTPGVTLFMQLPTAANSFEAFEHMYEMAKFLATHLEAEVLDEEHSTVTKQRIEYYKEKLRSFERSRLIPS